MPLVLDASVVVKLVVREPGTIEAMALLDEPEQRIAPDWMQIEVAAALWNKVKYSALLAIHAERSLASLPRFLHREVPAIELLREAWGLAFRLRHSVYDCLYLALALREHAVVVTADVALDKAARRAGLDGSVRLLTW